MADLLKFDATAIILAGGRARRMRGRDKARIVLDDRPLIEGHLEHLHAWFNKVLIVAQIAADYDYPDTTQVMDEQPNQGPVMGLYTGLRASTSDKNFVMACDMPWLNRQVIALLIEAADVDAIIPELADGRQPLMACYNQTAVPKIKDFLDQDQRKLLDLLNCLDIRTVSESQLRTVDPHLKSFTNINTDQDLIRARTLLDLPPSNPNF